MSIAYTTQFIKIYIKKSSQFHNYSTEKYKLQKKIIV